MNLQTLSALRMDVERGALAIASTDISTSDTKACWQELCANGININGYPAKATWVFDDVISLVKAIRRVWNIKAVA